MSLKSSARAFIKKPTPAKAGIGKPDFSFENQHTGFVCGLDEVGRGPLAGPVVAACVIIPMEKRTLPFVSDLRDSKKIAKPKLEALHDYIREHFLCSVAEVSVEDIDRINILQASMLAMTQAFDVLSTHGVRHALVDGNRCPKLACKSTAIVGGDNRSVSIAAASILAKVHRDRLMKTLAEEYPHYGWESNAGYGAPVHLAGIEKHGITPHHRKSFAPVRNFIAFGDVRGSLREAS